MSEWKKCKLVEYSNINMGQSPKSEYYNNEEIGIPFLQGNRTFGIKYPTYDTYCSQPLKFANEGEILFSVRAPVGDINIANRKICIGRGLAALNAKNGKNDFLYFLLHYLKSTIVNNESGSVFGAVNKFTLENIDILLPPLPEQTAIASILSSLDDKIDLLHRQNATLEKMAETLFRQWFVEEAKEEWKMGCLGDFLRPQKGRNITKSEAIEGKFPVVAGGLEPSCFHNQSNTKAPVITISASGANAGFVRLYYTPIWSSDSSFIDESITPYVFFFYIFLKFYQERLFDKQEGSAQPHIYPSHIMELELPKIPILLISNFESEISPLFNKIKSNQTQIRTLTTLRDTLLPKLMSGEVRVEY